ncbi:MAG: hypothetical protein ACLGSA_07980 [Acidobacteriota bacterium]
MFLDSELRDIQVAKDALTKRCAMHRMMLQLDALSVRTKAGGVVSGLKAGLAMAELVKDFLSSRTDRR